MWAFKVLPALLGLGPWFKSTVPKSNIEVVVVTHLVLEAPFVLPIITVTETVGIPATAITHAIPTTFSTSTPKSSRPRLDPHKYCSPDLTEPRYRAQDRVSTAHAMAVPQYSMFDFTVFLTTIFAFAIMAWWLAIVFMGRNCAMRKLGQVPAYINASLQDTGCRIGYGCVLLAWLGLLCDYWIGWSYGYVVWPRIYSFLLSYPLVLIVHFQLPPVKCIPLLCWRFFKTIVNGVRHWFVRQVNDWYGGRTSKRRIDKIFERPMSSITISECLFPDTCGVFPNPTTFSQIYKAFAKDVLFFGWNFILVVVKLRIRSWKQIPSHMLDVLRVTVQICFGFGQEDLSWRIWQGCYETFLKAVCAVVSVAWGLTKTFLGVVWVTLEMAKAIINRICVCVRVNRLPQPDDSTKREVKAYEDEVHNAYCETSTYGWTEVALLLLRCQAALEDVATSRAHAGDIIQFYSCISETLQSPEFLGLLDRCNITPYKSERNTFNILAKCASVNVRPEGFYGPQIEDVTEAMKKKFAPFDRDEISKFVCGMQFGASPLRQHQVASLPKLSAYSTDPWSTGERWTIDLPLYKNFA